MAFKVIIAGTRTFKDFATMKRIMDHILMNQAGEIEIVSGTAHGADKLGEMYARTRNYPIKQFPADWFTYGKTAGYLRNKQMAEYADACVVFWDGKSPGTKLMIDLAKEHKLKLRVINYGN